MHRRMRRTAKRPQVRAVGLTVGAAEHHLGGAVQELASTQLGRGGLLAHCTSAGTSGARICTNLDCRLQPTNLNPSIIHQDFGRTQVAYDYSPDVACGRGGCKAQAGR